MHAKKNYELWINNYELKEEIVDMYEENGLIIIETVMGVLEGNNLYNYTNLYSPIKENISGNILEYRDSLNSYKYTFKQNDKYYKFMGIEKLS